MVIFGPYIIVILEDRDNRFSLVSTVICDWENTFSALLARSEYGNAPLLRSVGHYLLMLYYWFEVAAKCYTCMYVLCIHACTYLYCYMYLYIHPGRVEPASPIALTTSRTEALQARRSCASSLGRPEIGSRSALAVVTHVFSWPPARLRHVRGGVGKRRSLISSPSGRLAAWPNQRRLLCTSSAGKAATNWPK